MKDETSIDDAPGVNRREFIKRTGAVAGAGVVSGGALLAASSDGWAQGLVAFDAATGKALLQMCRDLYPHDRVPDAMYQKVVDMFDAAALKDPAVAQMMTDGVGELNAASRRIAKRDYAATPRETDRVAALQSIEGSAFFGKVRGDMIAGLYNNPDVWEVLGYEGASAHLGGYINRGFNDIDWV